MDFFDSFEKILEADKKQLAAAEAVIKEKQDNFDYETVFEENKSLKAELEALKAKQLETIPEEPAKEEPIAEKEEEE